jgi:hypothetical protein
MKILKILKISINHVDLKEIIILNNNIIFDYDKNFYISSLEGEIIIIDKKYSIFFDTSNKKSQEIFSYDKNNKTINDNLIHSLPIKKNILLKIIEFITYIYDKDNNFDKNNIDNWCINFIDINNNLYLKNSDNKIHIFEILFSSNYIGIKYLYELTCYKISKIINTIELDKLIKIEVYINNTYPHMKIKNTIINYLDKINEINNLYIDKFY